MHGEIVAALVLPGWAARRRRRALAIGLLVAGVAAPLVPVAYALWTGRNWVALSLDGSFLALVVVTGAVAVVARSVALAEVWTAHGRPRSFERVDVVAGVLAVLLLVIGTGAIVEVGRARASLAPTFTPVADDTLFDAERPLEPISVTTVPATGRLESTTPRRSVAEEPAAPVAPARVVDAPPTSTTSTTTTLPPKPTRPDSGVNATELSDVTTVLLLGGDAGPGRQGLRTDTMMLFSVHRPSGRAALVSVPRDLERLLFPPGSALEARYPYGYRDMANAVYPRVSASRSLRDAYALDGVRPGVVALAQGLGYSLDVTIHDYVLVDMQGFLDLIDALGGVTVDVTKQIPMPGNVPGAPATYPDTIGPGIIEMDGTTALGYVRSRYGDNDYRRAGRQRDLLASLAQQISLTDVVLSFGPVAAAVGGTLRTSLTPDELTDTLNVIGGETAVVESVGLVPPLVNVRRPDYDAMAKVVGRVQLALVTGIPSGY